MLVVQFVVAALYQRGRVRSSFIAATVFQETLGGRRPAWP